MDKKGWTKGYRSAVSLILGLIFLFIGSFQLLLYQKVKVLDFLSPLMSNDVFIYVCLVIGGLLLFIDSFSISHGGGKLLSILAGLIMLAVGILPLLVLKVRILNIPLPFTNLTIFQGILAFFGIYLLIDAFVMKSHKIANE